MNIAGDKYNTTILISTQIKSHGPGPKKHNKNTLCGDLVTTCYFTNALDSLTLAKLEAWSHWSNKQANFSYYLGMK